jgi:NAD(P)-dependent dehydrogenase (short-subunit alcohol dehydrogenase family)
LIPKWSFYDPFSVLGQDPERLTQELNTLFTTNVVGQIHLINLFMPLILKGSVKKVITISSGMADPELAAKYNLYENAPYSISKAAVNMAVAKFQAEYNDRGVLFLAVCPGPVDTGLYDESKLLHYYRPLVISQC